jgi:iron complex outermembrane recepter protein
MGSHPLIGTDVRHEFFSSNAFFSNSPDEVQSEHQGRSVPGAFTEIRGTMFARVEASAGYRVERDDGIRVGVPKVGIHWTPVRGLSLRSTWGRSYRTPGLGDTLESSLTNGSLLFTLPDPQAPNGRSLVLAETGNNGDLQPERTSTSTAGLDFVNGRISMSATYFRIRSRGRIYQPTFSLGALAGSYDGLVIRNPTQSQQLAACQRNFHGDIATCLNAPIAALVDNRLQNLDLLETTGLDLTIKEQVRAGAGQLEWGANASRLFDYSLRHGPDQQIVQLLNTQDEPLKLRARAFTSWSVPRLSVEAALNFASGYSNTGSVLARNVAPWTTADLHFSYRPQLEFPGGRWELSLTCRNVFNRLSPLLDGPQAGWDPENGNYTGRFLSAGLKVTW